LVLSLTSSTFLAFVVLAFAIISFYINKRKPEIRYSQISGYSMR
jgi:hypothetical protein